MGAAATRLVSKVTGYHSVPVPDSETFKGVAVALVAMASFADLLAAASGRNLTPIVQELPGARFAGQLFDCRNHEALVPVTLIATEKGALPLFVSEAFSVPLVVPTATLPNFRLDGLTDAAGVTLSVLDLVMALAVAEMDTAVLASTLFVPTEKSADFKP